MNASQKLEQYLESFRQRLRKLVILRGAAVAAVAILLLSLTAAWFSLESGYSDATVIAFRVLFVVALAAVIYFMIVQPLQTMKRGGISSHVEKRSAQGDGKGFDGRIETYAQMKERDNPFRELLAEDALNTSSAYPVQDQVRKRDLNISGAVTAAAFAILVYLVLAAPGMFNYSLQNFFAGWASDNLRPPQSIAVNPGDQSIRRGANLRITSTVEGFDPDEATLHVNSAGEGWQEVPLVQTPEGFEFTFFSVQDPMDYYVSTRGGLRSPEYNINVVDLPSIDSMSLTYNYPAWTNRDPETFTEGDIQALPETRIDLNVTTTAPLPAGGRLVLNETPRDLQVDGVEASAEFTVTEEGQYYIAANVGGEPVRLSDDFFIRLAEDGSPEIEFLRPGEDWNATNIEEVLTRIEASDDYGLESLTLKYAINGGEWREIDLAENRSERTITAEHVFMLEDMRAPAQPDPATVQGQGRRIGEFNIVVEPLPEGAQGPRAEENNSGDNAGESGQSGDGRNSQEETLAGGESEQRDAAATETPEPEMVPLKPGDLIAYYAEASDRTRTVQSDMFFIQVQNFTRRYTQSQLSGGGGGGGGGRQDEISQRQRQIVVSTWNLIREQAAGDPDGQVDINASLLSDLQQTLADQARTLSERTRARQLNQQDADIERFVQNMDLAVQDMMPASERLAEVDLDQAIQPAQEALQHLLQAEAVFNDITITQQQGGGGGGSGRAQEDLAEMFELEMDMEANQYETRERISQQQSQQQQAQDLMDRLDELARRQEQLANNMRNQQQLTDAQRYQQEMLRREAEAIREELQRMQQNQSGQQGQQQANNQQSNEQQGQQGQQGEQGQPGQQGQQSGQPGQQQGQPGQQNGQLAGNNQQPGGQNGEITQNELERRLESAIRAMNETEQAMRGDAGNEDLQRTAEEAQRQLEGARDQVAQQQIEDLQQTFENMAEQSEEMVREQQRLATQLQEAMQRALEERESGDNPSSRGMDAQQEYELSRAKEELAGELQTLQQQMMRAIQEFSEQAPGATREVERANNTIAERELELALSDAALYIDAGYGLYITGNERNVTEAMRELNERLENARQLAGGEAGQESDAERARQQAEALRDQLARAGQPGQQQGQQDQQQGQGQQPGQQQGQGQQQGEQQPGQQGGRFGGGNPANRDIAGPGWNGEDFTNDPIELPENFYENVGNLTDLSRQAVADMDLSAEERQEIMDLIRQLEFSQSDRNQQLLTGEYSNMLALIEQLEVSLEEDGSNGDPDNVRTATADEIPEEYRETVAEYFRRLSREGD